MEPHPPGSGRGRALAQAVLSAMVGAGLHRAWNRPQRVPLPTRYWGGGPGGGVEMGVLGVLGESGRGSWGGLLGALGGSGGPEGGHGGSHGGIWKEGILGGALGGFLGGSVSPGLRVLGSQGLKALGSWLMGKS